MHLQEQRHLALVDDRESRGAQAQQAAVELVGCPLE